MNRFVPGRDGSDFLTSTMFPMIATWIGTIGHVNTATVDGRFLLLDEGTVPARELPLPLHAHGNPEITRSRGGDAIIQIGKIETIAREDNRIVASGSINTELLDLLDEPPEDQAAIPISIAVEQHSNSAGWRITAAFLAPSAWPGDTIKIN